ncbi:MAG: hypothetical protein R3D88_03270 [Alphaproteobacteria bacterium]|nr:hypothetical protein [Alphaproteobacteria bacterium]
MANTKKPEVTQAQIDHARHAWIEFTKFMKYGVIATIGAVIVLALITL